MKGVHSGRVQLRERALEVERIPYFTTNRGNQIQCAELQSTLFCRLDCVIFMEVELIPYGPWGGRGGTLRSLRSRWVYRARNAWAELPLWVWGRLRAVMCYNVRVWMMV